MLSIEQWTAINNLIYKIYAAHDNIRLRKIFLTDFGHLIPHNFAFFDLWQAEKDQYCFHDPISLTISKEQMDEYYNRFEKMDYVAKIACDIENSVVLRNTDVLTPYTRSQSALYKEFFPSIEGGYVCGAFIRHESIPYASICFGRKESAGDFTDDEIEIMNILIKHAGQKFHQLDKSASTLSSPTQIPLSADAASILSKREAEIAALLLFGLNSEEIASRLYISSGTVRKHISNIYQKLHVSNKTQFIIRMISR